MPIRLTLIFSLDSEFPPFWPRVWSAKNNKTVVLVRFTDCCNRVMAMRLNCNRWRGFSTVVLRLENWDTF